MNRPLAGIHTNTKYSMPVIYLINSENLIVELNQEWDEFASENNGGDLSCTEVIGRPLMDFVSGKSTKQYWENIFNKARSDNQATTLEYRCDSPSVKRWMRMEILPLVDGNLRISNDTLSTKERPYPIHFERMSQRGKHTFIRCSLCNKLKIKDIWIEPDEFAAKHRISTFAVTYGVCPAHQIP